MPNFLFINLYFLDNNDNIIFADNLEQENAVYNLRIQYDN